MLTHQPFMRAVLRIALALLACLVQGRVAQADEPAAGPTASVAQAQDYPTPGSYRGQLPMPDGGSHLEVILHLGPSESGQWAALLDVPEQKASGLPLRDVVVTADKIGFTLDSPAGTATFEGKWDLAAKTITGVFKQAGMQLPLTLVLDDSAKRLADAQAKLADLPAKMTQWLSDWKVPGSCVAVFYDGQVVLSQGYGVKNLDSKAPVTADTLFPIGSATKAFTTLLLAQEADAGQLDWDKPVRDYLPDFKLYNDYLTDHVTVRDLVTHRTGLPRHDALWYGSPFTREQMVSRLQYLEPNEPLRAKWQYNNLMFMTAGYLAGKLGGATWEDLVQQRILTPLGMSATQLTTPACCAAPDHADGYWQLPDAKGLPGPPSFIALSDFPALAPAGSISSSANDMVKWLQFQLGDGKWQGQPLVSSSQLNQLHTMQAAIGSSADNVNSPIQGYGMGWFISDYRGHYCVDHGGNIDGFSAMVRLFPHDKLGIVVLSNLAATPVPSIAAYGVADRLLGLSENDISARALAQTKQGEAAAAAGQQAQPKLPTGSEPGAKPAHPLADYTGSYVHPGYGEVKISQGPQGALNCNFNGFNVTLEHTQFETFKVVERSPLLAELQLLFVTDIGGHVSGLAVTLEPAVDPIVFKHNYPSPLQDPDFAAAAPGAYELAGQSVTISLRNGVLYALVPGQPEYELVPAGGLEFSLKTLSGYSVRFDYNAKTKQVDKLYFVQPDGTYEAVRK